ncbi:hypothetical protein P5673_018770 [Acropora cervicornis]|uniref:Myb-like domain-containing protein n=1 Tax=Acropora cervicornis TaxID=6130 RepID=A0AAD9QC63_ACRCE|nr:hypothetical protein P5673_018770 [Acropora cervicornis]
MTAAIEKMQDSKKQQMETMTQFMGAMIAILSGHLAAKSRREDKIKKFTNNGVTKRQQIVTEGQEAERFICKYVDYLVSPENPCNPDTVIHGLETEFLALNDFKGHPYSTPRQEQITIDKSVARNFQAIQVSENPMKMQQREKKKLFIWKRNHDILLLQEALHLEPYKFSSSERGQIWTKIPDTLNACPETKFQVTQRSCRERFKKRMGDHDKKDKMEQKAVGIDAQYGEYEQLYGNEAADLSTEDKNGYIPSWWNHINLVRPGMARRKRGFSPTCEGACCVGCWQIQRFR